MFSPKFNSIKHGNFVSGIVTYQHNFFSTVFDAEYDKGREWEVTWSIFWIPAFKYNESLSIFYIILG